MKTFKAYMLTEANLTKISANRGDVAEVILGAAVVARFWKHPIGEKVSESDIRSIIRMVLKSNPISLNRNDLEINTKISDTIRFRVGVPKPAYNFLKQEKEWDKISDLFQSSLSYVNSERRLILQSKALAKNGKINDIFVNSDGTGDQKGTKADIKLEVDGKKTRNQISLKVQGGDQFMQIGGVNFDKQEELWSKLGINVSSVKKQYNDYIKKLQTSLTFYDRDSVTKSGAADNIRLAAELTYKIAAKELQDKIDKKDGEIIKKLSNLIKSGATKDDDNIELVKLQSGKFKKAKFGKKYYENVKNANLIVSYKRSTDPIILVYDKELGPIKGKLIQFRARYSIESTKSKTGKTYRPYLRNLLETGPLLFELASDI
jgi:hypothetical protein